NNVFVAGVVAPFAAVLIYGLVYSLMTSLSRDVEKDWGFRLFVAAVAMALPSVLTFVLAFRQSRRKKLSMLARIGFVIAALTLGLVAKPAHDGILRSRQERNMALHDVAAPQFETKKCRSLIISTKNARNADLLSLASLPKMPKRKRSSLPRLL